ncbi:MAG: hypothetical protein REI09_04530 [Candidatus Dactylopiibacterium sp.]|nr:hypothetical protein [Candidatus Dactylopiibacterium sp.]
MPTSPVSVCSTVFPRRPLRYPAVIVTGLLALSLAACGGGDSSEDASAFAVGGTLSGLRAGAQITLRNNGTDELTLNKDGTFSFTSRISRNGPYAVTVAAQPSGQTCAVTQGSSTSAGITADVTTVSVVCSAITQAIGGTVTGLGAGKQLTLLNNGRDALAISADGNFTFVTPVPHGGSYEVTVGTQPENQTCSVSGAASGSVGTTGIVVTCLANTTRLASATQFDFPAGVAVDSGGTLYVASYRDENLFVISPGATRATPAPSSLNLSAPLGVAVAPNGDVIILDNAGDRVLKWVPNASTATRLVTGTTFDAPGGVAVDAQGNVYVADMVQNAVYKITPGATTATPIATGTVFNRPGLLAVDTAGNVYVAERNTSNNRLFMIAPGASTATPVATGMSFGYPGGVAVDSRGNLFVTDAGSLYKIAPGAATGVKIMNAIQSPRSLAVDASDNLYVADDIQGYIYKLDRP